MEAAGTHTETHKTHTYVQLIQQLRPRASHQGEAQNEVGETHPHRTSGERERGRGVQGQAENGSSNKQTRDFKRCLRG